MLMYMSQACGLDTKHPGRKAARRPKRDRSASDLSGGGWGGPRRPCPAPAYAASSAPSAAAGWRACIQSAACCALAAAVKIARLSPLSTFNHDAT